LNLVPCYSGNIAKVGVKHQPINQSINRILLSLTLKSRCHEKIDNFHDIA